MRQWRNHELEIIAFPPDSVFFFQVGRVELLSKKTDGGLKNCQI